MKPGSIGNEPGTSDADRAQQASADLLRLVPPNGVIEYGHLWMLLELMDRRKQRHEQFSELQRETHAELTTKLQRRALQVDALMSLLLLTCLKATVWALSRTGLIDRRHYDRTREMLAERAVGADVGPDADQRPFEMQRDEIAAEQLVAERESLFESLARQYTHAPMVRAYLSRYRETAVVIGQRLAESALVGRRASIRAEREASIFRSSLTSFGAMISLGAFIKTGLFALLAFFGVYLLFPAGDDGTTSSGVARLTSATVGAALALGVSGLRLFFGFRRLTRVQRDAQRRGAEARLAYLVEERRAVIEAWHGVEELYLMLTGDKPSSEALQAQRDRLQRLDHGIKREELDVLANSPEIGFRKRVKGLFEGMLQGDISDAL